jgi:hypothetical protein
MKASAVAAAAKKASTSSLVRNQVRELLSRSPAFGALPPDKRRQVARDTVRVASYMADPNGLVAHEFRDPLLAGVVRQHGARPAPRRAGKPQPMRLQAGSAATDALVQAVDFPGFVAGLIEGVFAAIVNASLQQMDAYAALVAALAKSVDQFASDNISDRSARDALVEAFPDVFCWAGTATARRLKVHAEGSTGLSRLTATLGLATPLGDLRSAGGLKRVVAATRRRLARDRQQLLATMVLMGINRIVVTNGRIVPKLTRLG